MRETPAIRDALEAARREGRVAEGPPARLPAPGLHPASAGESEESFQARVIAHARARGWLVAHFRGVRVQRADGSVYWQTPVQADGKGFPDLILVRGGRVLALELKVGPNKPSREQLAWLAAFGAAGVASHCFWTEDWKTIEGLLA